ALRLEGCLGRQPRPWFTTPENPARRDAIRASNAGFLETQKPGRLWKAPNGPEMGIRRFPGLPGRGEKVLLEFDLGASFFQLLLRVFGGRLVRAFLDGLRSAVDQVLGFLQAQAGDFAHSLDDVDLVGADFGQNDRELGLLFSSGG